jgi:aminocarboxymuconate-semialdehyde decarboxylase
MPNSRRRFIGQLAGATAGIVFSHPAASAWSQSGPGRRREVSVAGRRVTTVDAHAHCFIPAVVDILAGTELAKTAAASAKGPLVMGDDRLRAMDVQGIDLEVLTINPYWYSADRELSRRLIEAQNRELGRLCAARPDRFVALGTVALQHPDLAAQQLDQAVNEFGLRGASIGASVNGEELAARRFDAFWAKAEALGVLVFMHPQGVPQLSGRLQGNGFLGNVIGNPLDTTIALSHLIFEGTFDRFPGLKIGAAHAGGFLPSYNGRSDQGCVAFPQNCTNTLKKKPSEYLKQMYFDSMVFNGEGLRHLVAEYGSSQIVMGTDYPFPWTTTAVDHILEAPGLTDADRVAVLGGNLVRLLKIKA